MKKPAAVVVAALALAVPAAQAKDFRPGDLRLCGTKGCVPVTDPAVLQTLAAFYYRAGSPRTVAAPRLGGAELELRFRNGYVTGIVAGDGFGRFLSWGVNLGRFEAGTWYRVPPSAAAALRTLGARLSPYRLTAAAEARSR
jgi:hypothetical protein